MPQVEAFSRTMIQNYLNSKGFKYLTDSDGDFHITFAYDEELDCATRVLLMASGSREDVYCLRFNADKRIPRNSWPRALALCNRWNREKRWPKAYLDIDDNDDSAVSHIRLEMDLDCEKGVHQELINDMTNIFVMAGHEFWKWYNDNS